LELICPLWLTGWDEPAQESEKRPMNLQAIRQQTEAALVNSAASDEDFRAKLIVDPKKTVSDTFGFKFKPNVRVFVHEEAPDELHLVLPVQLSVDDNELSDQNLEAVAGGTTLSIDSSALNITPAQPVVVGGSSQSVLVVGSMGVPAGAPLDTTTVSGNPFASATATLTGSFTQVQPKGSISISQPATPSFQSGGGLSLQTNTSSSSK
jgi:hypothetical protein